VLLTATISGPVIMPKVLPSKIVELIDGQFPFARAGDFPALDRQFADRIAAIIRLVDELPAELIKLDGTQYNSFVVALEGLRSTLALWNAGGQLEFPAATRVSRQIGNLRDALAVLPDQHIPENIATLTFIKDKQFRKTLVTDIAAAEQANDNGEWKAATVLGGSIIEALLLWKLNSRTASARRAAAARCVASGALTALPSPNLNRWELKELIEVAREMQIITHDTYNVVSAARNFRNLIHPGRAERTGQACDRSTAYNAISGIDRVIHDLTP
jgi:hypothetical protein